jgi:hypothetical protein
MHRSLLYGVLAGLLLLAPNISWAANPNWVKVVGSGDCGALNGGSVCSFHWTSAAAVSSGFLQTASRPFSLRIEPDKTGADTAAQADVYACTTTSTDSCTALQWDTDGDGVVDDNTLDSTNAMKVGTPVFLGIPWIYIDPIANPAASHTAEVVATGEQGP